MTYASLNVLNKPFGTEATVNSVNAMVNSYGSRSQRRDVMKTMHSRENIRKEFEAEYRRKLQESIGDRSDDDLIWLLCTVADVLYEDYHWKETPDNDHGQISSFMEKFVKRMNNYAAKGYSTRYMVEYIEKKTGIMLVPDKRWKNNL